MRVGTLFINMPVFHRRHRRVRDSGGDGCVLFHKPGDGIEVVSGDGDSAGNAGGCLDFGQFVAGEPDKAAALFGLISRAIALLTGDENPGRSEDPCRDPSTS